MTLLPAIVLAFATALVVSCDDSVPLVYSTRAEAEWDTPFARGWLPIIIPASCRAISMTNNIDLNLSSGEFVFDPTDHDEFVQQLMRIPQHDKEGLAAYSFEKWLFWIGPDQSHCRFQLLAKRP